MSTFQRHGLNARGSLNVLGFIWSAGVATIMAQPAGIVYPGKWFCCHWLFCKILEKQNGQNKNKRW